MCDKISLDLGDYGFRRFLVCGSDSLEVHSSSQFTIV